MQACASGGGRINYGLLPYYDEFWTSDNTDALQRIFIQWGVSNFFPAVAMASHVSVDTNYQTGRKTPLKLRFDVAMSGRMGMELQPAHMTDEDKAFARRAIADYKLIRPVVQQGDLYRLISPFDKTGYASLMYVSPEKTTRPISSTSWNSTTTCPGRRSGWPGSTRRRGTSSGSSASTASPFPRTARPSPGRS